MDYINEHFPKPKLKKGEFYDTFTKRAYVPDPIDSYYGATYEEAKKDDKKKEKSAKPSWRANNSCRT